MHQGDSYFYLPQHHLFVILIRSAATITSTKNNNKYNFKWSVGK